MNRPQLTLVKEVIRVLLLLSNWEKGIAAGILTAHIEFVIGLHESEGWTDVVRLVTFLVGTA